MDTDITIIGGGIAGLYCGYKLMRDRPDLSFVILEKSCRNETPTGVSAGRLGSSLFEKNWVSCGGGIGTENCRLLIALLDEMNIDYHWFDLKHRTDNKDDEAWFNMKVNVLKSACIEMNGLTFYEFAMQYMSYSEYERFMYISGYRDYENNDSYHALNYYIINDNIDNFRAFTCQWGLLISALYRKLDGHIQFESEVMRIQYNTDSITVEYNNKYLTSNVVINATAIDGITKLFTESMYDSIASQSESRIYVKIAESKTIRDILSGYQIVHVKNIAQKMIPINLKDNIIMASYCDNIRADTMSKFNTNTPDNREYIGRLMDDSLRTYADVLPKSLSPIIVLNMLGFYNNISVHIFKPLVVPLGVFIKSIQFPRERVYVVGEAVALKHGWVESALQSTIMMPKFIDQYFPQAFISNDSNEEIHTYHTDNQLIKLILIKLKQNINHTIQLVMPQRLAGVIYPEDIVANNRLVSGYKVVIICDVDKLLKTNQRAIYDNAKKQQNTKLILITKI